jgi:hypothetical protein
VPQSRLVVTSLILALTGIPTFSIAAPNPPEQINVTFDINVGDLPASCAFPIRISAEGKSKTIALPDNRFILTSPGLKATVTNLANPSRLVTLNITGAFHQRTDPDGSVVTVVTGRNFLTDPLAGVVLAIGSFSYAFDASGNVIQPLAGSGQLINICSLIN